MIRYDVRTLHGQTGLWAVWLDRPDTRFADPSYPALYAPVGGEAAGPVCGCAVGRTPLLDKREVDREEAAALHPALVRRAEEEFGQALDDVGRRDNAGGDASDGAAVLAELDRIDPDLDIAEVDALLSADRGEA